LLSIMLPEILLMPTSAFNRIPSGLDAVIDIGSNTIRLLIAGHEPGKLTRLLSQREVTRLSSGLQASGLLNEANIGSSIDCLSRFRSMCDELHVDNVYAVGTAALREACNREEFISRVKREAGIDIHVISGDAEADLTLKGVRPLLDEYHSSVLAVDIGGGSTEFIYSNGRALSFSCPVGAVKIHEEFIDDPPSFSEITGMKYFIRSEFETAASKIGMDKPVNDNCQIIFTGGTPTTLAAIDMKMDVYDGDMINGHRLTLADVNIIFTTLASLSANDRNMAGLERERADIILAGTLIMIVIMEVFRLSEITVSDYGLMEGILLEGI
jgi:exopolyphosphatase / guanosine-5'-triphosphate,3'-diphosphate pyrophosphatase